MKAKKILITIFFGVIFASNVCFSNHFANEINLTGVDDAPFKDHTVKYDLDFSVLRKDFFKTIEIFHTFSQYNNFEPSFNQCFNYLFKKGFSNNFLPCIITYAEKGSPVNIQMTYKVNKKHFDNDEKPDYFDCSIMLTTSDDKNNSIVDLFSKEIDFKIKELDYSKK